MAWNDALQAQYDAATNGAGLVRLRDWTALAVEGADRVAFLHNMCTNDIRSLPVGGQTEAFLTDVKGKIVGHAIVLAEAEALVLLTVPDQAEALIAHLSRYVIREDVQLDVISPHVEWSLVIGREAAQAIPSLPTSQNCQFASAGILRAPCQQIWPGGYWIGAVEGAALNLGGAVACDGPVWHALRIESGWPLFGVDFDGSHFPQEAGRDAQAISFRKGCYLGQETIARIDALGHVNKRLATVRLGGEANVGAELVANGQVVGALSSVTWSPRLQSWLAFAMVRRGHNEPGSKLECQNQAAEVVPTPAAVA